MIELDVGKGRIEFKKPVSLDELAKAMKHFEKLYKLLFKAEATYKDFTDFLATQDGVKLTPGVKVGKKK